MTLRVTLVQGGGLGFDQVPAVKRVLEAAGVHIDWDEHLAGWASLERGGDAIPQTLLRSVRDHTGVTTLHITHHRGEADRLADRLFLLQGGRVEEVSTAPGNTTGVVPARQE